ncbi:MAG: tautomerase family protein [Bacteroidales bacterium]|nr:tautomerase family protein [Bacteroidales bacterium]
MPYINVKVVKQQVDQLQKDALIAGKELVKRTLGSNDLTNYFIIYELNPDSWGFDGIPMTVRNKMEQNK